VLPVAGRETRVNRSRELIASASDHAHNRGNKPSTDLPAATLAGRKTNLPAAKLAVVVLDVTPAVLIIVE